MTIEELIRALEETEKPSRVLDIEIGIAAGFQKLEDEGHSGDRWTSPRGKIGPLPQFTSSLNAAYVLSMIIAPNNIGGCIWHDGKGTAQLNGAQHYEGATPAIALCIAAIHAKASI